MANTFDYDPYPFSARKGLLFLLGLPSDADKATYEAAWNKAVAPAKNGDYSKTLFNNVVADLQSKGRTFAEAHNLALITEPGRTHFKNYTAEAEAKKHLTRKK